jgi:catechol 2,3-dioxygenase-like lactoylglutathione lyase family enzyme
MPINRLDHYSLRTTDLAATERFYTDIMGFEAGPRPNFPFPGAWLYQGGMAVVHVIGIDPADSEGLKGYLGDKPAESSGTGSIDHIAFTGTEVEAVRAHFRAAGIPFRDRLVPTLNLEQVFL